MGHRESSNFCLGRSEERFLWKNIKLIETIAHAYVILAVVADRIESTCRTGLQRMRNVCDHLTRQVSEERHEAADAAYLD